MFPHTHLDPASTVPIYRQLSHQIREFILSGQLSPGDRLPATRELAGLLGLNRATVTAAYRLLENDGLIRGHVGRGSFVQGPVYKQKPTSYQWDTLLLQNEANPAPASGAPISFASSRPSQELFPLEDFRAVSREVIESGALAGILQLGSPYGYQPLRLWLLEQAAARPDDDIVVTNGCQQAVDLLQRIFVQPGDAILIEDPVYPGLREVFARAGARVLGIPIGPAGVDLHSLEISLRRDRPKLVVVTPNFQNPTGATLPLPARHALLQLCRSAGAILIENDIYTSLRYEGDPLDSLKTLDESASVIQIGSFSKIAFPGLRVGWVLAPRPVAAAIAQAKQWSDLHSDHLAQAVLFRFAASGRLEAHRARVVEAGRRRLGATLEACATHLPNGSRFTRPQGGMNVWVRLPAPLDAADLLRAAESEGVSYLPGKFFAVSAADPGSLRLSFAGLAPEAIRRGIEMLGKLFSAELARSRDAASREPVPAMV